MKFEHTEVFNFKGAFRGMRNPKESWSKSDSSGSNLYGDFFIGDKDLKLAQTLIKAGSEHRKFLRQIFVSVDITAPLYWWKEADQYKVGIVSNSTSTMHKLADTPITRECFEMDDFENLEGNFLVQDNGTDDVEGVWNELIQNLEDLRQRYNKLMENKKHLEEIKEFEEAKKAQVMAKKYWKELIRMLPESWLQRRTVTMDYENLLAMCSKGQRRFHKLTEWSKAFIEWARELPYAQELIFLDELEEKE
jgi:hypothetical protein